MMDVYGLDCGDGLQVDTYFQTYWVAYIQSAQLFPRQSYLNEVGFGFFFTVV